MAPESPLRPLLERSFAILAAERPAAWARLGDRLRACPIAIALGEAERFVLVAGARGPAVVDAAPARVSVWLEASTVRALLGGGLRLDGAVSRDRLRLQGRVDDLVTALDCLDGYVHLSLRSAASAGLCAALLA